MWRISRRSHFTRGGNANPGRMITAGAGNPRATSFRRVVT